MANTHAAEKDLRKNKRRATQNLRIRRHVKALWKSSRALVKKEGGSGATDKLRELQQALAKAAKRHVIHANAARRRTSALMKLARIK